MPDACRRVLLALFLALLPLAAAENAEGPRPVRALQSAPSQLLFNFTASRGYANSMQVSEIRLYDASGNLITTTGATNPGGTPPYPQQMAFAAEDGSIYTKWVDTSFGANGNSQLLLVPSTPVPISYCEPATPTRCSARRTRRVAPYRPLAAPRAAGRARAPFPLPPLSSIAISAPVVPPLTFSSPLARVRRRDLHGQRPHQARSGLVDRLGLRRLHLYDTARLGEHRCAAIDAPDELRQFQPARDAG